MAQVFRAKKTSNKGKILTLDVKSLDHQGRGVANHQGKVCFGDGALPNDLVKAQILDEKSKFIEAKQVKIITPSTERISPFCKHYGDCGGCQLQHLGIENQLEYKQIAVSKLFEKFNKSKCLPWQSAISSPAKGYRRSARIACMFDKKSKKVKLGFRAHKSKSIVEVESCPILSRSFEDIFVRLRTLINSKNELRCISHVQLCEADNQQFILIRHTHSLEQSSKIALESLFESDSVMVLWDDGETALTYPILPYYLAQDIKFNFKLSNFIQVNAVVNEKMLARTSDWLALTKQDVVIDLFCGIGNFSLLAAKEAKFVIGVEGVEESVQSAIKNSQLKDN